MAQTGSAQREPSMEEILASIRRIIEDSDTARKPLEEPELPQLSPLSEAQAGHDEPEVEVFEAELREPQAVSMPQAGFAGWPERDLSAADEDGEADRPADRQIVHALRPASDAPQPHLSPVRPATDFASSVEEDNEPVPAAFVAQAETHAGEGRAMLMSDRAGRQVAAAFGELSEAFAASRRRSFDEMAEEMLRPMLQDWLDNNLPTLVERLVREEIERVARGG